MREACAQSPCPSQPILKFHRRSFGVHGEVKVGLCQLCFKGWYCLSIWLRNSRTLVPTCESAGDLSHEVVIMTGASRRSSRACRQMKEVMIN